MVVTPIYGKNRTKFNITRWKNADFRMRSVRKIAFYTRSDVKNIIVFEMEKV